MPLVPAPATSVPINLHTHGLHVGPNLNADNVLLDIPAGMGNTYEYDIPFDHPQGCTGITRTVINSPGPRCIGDWRG